MSDNEVVESEGAEGQVDDQVVNEPQSESAPDPAAEASEKTFRDFVTDDKYKKQAERFEDMDSVFRSMEDLRKKVSTSVVIPGKDAADEDIAAYRKQIGVPESVDGYSFPQPPEGVELTEEQANSQKEWAQMFHDNNVPKDLADSLIAKYNADVQAGMDAINKADEVNAAQQEKALRDKWGADYEENKAIATRAFNDLASKAGVDLEVLNQMETKDGKLLMDRAEMIQLFAGLGREMKESGLATMSDSERDNAQDQLESIRKQITEAQSNRDTKKANSLYQKEQELLERMG